MLKKMLLMLVLVMSLSLPGVSYPVADASFPPDRTESKRVLAEPAKSAVKPSPQGRKSDLIEKFLKLIRPWLRSSA